MVQNRLCFLIYTWFKLGDGLGDRVGQIVEYLVVCLHFEHRIRVQLKKNVKKLGRKKDYFSVFGWLFTKTSGWNLTKFDLNWANGFLSVMVLVDFSAGL